MDIVKTLLLLSIGIIAYYLLLQWPPSSVTVVENGNKESIVYKTLDESKDSLTPLSVVPSKEIDNDSINSDEPATDSSFVIENDILSLRVSGKSGAFISSQLKEIKEIKSGEALFELFGSNRKKSYLANSGFFSSDGGFIFPYLEKISKEINSKGEAVFTLSGSSGNYRLKKIISLSPGSYSIQVSDVITKIGGSSTTVTPYAVLERNDAEISGDTFAYAYLGPVFSTQDDRFEKISFDDLLDDSFEKKSLGGWASIIQHYFLTAWVPDQTKEYYFQAKKNPYNDRFSVGYTGESSALSDSSNSHRFSNILFVGPKLTNQLERTHQDLSLVVDYGFLWWLGKPVYWLLNLGYELLGNWGFAIIFLTIVLKIFLWPLSAKAYKSMGKMRSLSPKLQALQTAHGDDKQKMGQAMMDLYKKEGVNPLGGCLPMLAQMPFFLAFYWVLVETVELRHSPFIFWITDLSTKDPLFVLPLLNAAGMYYSQKLTPTPPNADPMQAQMMKYFPLVFAFLFAWFPSGLVLYWLINMLVTLIQQWWYYRKEGGSIFTTKES